jgi:hypothetical protein
MNHLFDKQIKRIALQTMPINVVSAIRILVWIVSAIFLALALANVIRFAEYALAVFRFGYEWGPSDGDHLNMAHRLAQGLPIYLSMDAGKVLSIYTPLYHALIAFIGGEDASLGLARFCSLAFWALLPVVVIRYQLKNWGVGYTALAIAALLIAPSLDFMVHVTPDSLMVLLFAVAMLEADSCRQANETRWWRWALIGVIAALCYLAKQQGLVAIISLFAFLMLKKATVRYGMFVILGFLTIFIGSTIWLEWLNTGEYLESTLFALRKIMPTNFDLASTRLKVFLLMEHPGLLVGAIGASVYLFWKKKVAISIWQVALIVHVPFLLKILSNAGGGDNYFLTLWVTLIFCSLGIVRGCEEHNASVLMKNKWKLLLPKILILLILFDLSRVALQVYTTNKNTPHPSAWLAEIEARHYKQVGQLINNQPDGKALTRRVVGSMAGTRIRIENEGGAMFDYAWIQPLFRDKVLASIKNREYAIIATGMQDYPLEVTSAIEADYTLALVSEANFMMGNVGLMRFYIPK